MKTNLQLSLVAVLCFVSLLLTGCDEQIEGHPDYWANSYFGQTSPYPMGLLNPVKKEYKYSIPWTVVQTDDNGYLFGGLLRTFEESNAMLFKLNSKGVVEKGFVVHDGTTVGEDRQSGVITTVFDSGDGFVISGWVSRSSSGNIIKSNSCMWMMKLDYSGAIIWNKAYGQTSYYEDSSNDSPSDLFMAGVVYSAVETHDGGFVLAGKQLVKVDSQGNVEWSKLNQYGVIKDIKVTSDNGLIITAVGNQYSTNTLLKTDDTGTVIWSKEYHVEGFDSGFTAVEIIIDENGEESGYLLGGTVRYQEARNTDCLLVSTDMDGNIIWNYTYNGVLYDADSMIFSEETISSVIQSNDGNYLVGITSESFEEELNDDDHIVIKINEEGSVIWEKAYDVFSGRLMDLSPTDKGFVFTGDLSGEGDWQSLVVTCDNDGNVPDHGNDLTIRDISFMEETPYSYMTDTTGDDNLYDIDLVSVDLQSTLKEVTTDRVRR